MKHRFSPNPRHRGRNAAAARALGAKRGKRVPSIDISKFINKATVIEQVEAYQPTYAFTDFGLHDRLVANLTARGYKQPTAIQDQAILPIMKGQDVIGLANTGTGKTAAFSLPIIHRILAGDHGDALIVVPTRELATQIRDECAAFTQGMGIKMAVCIGGQNIKAQIGQLKRRPRIIIGTPGRLKDLIVRKNLSLQHSNTLVLDEVDRMLDMGFIHDIRFLVEQMPAVRQSLFFSATMTKDIDTLAHTFLHNPTTISVRTRETSEHVEQDIVYVSSNDDKLDQLHRMLTQPEFRKVIVFGGTKWGVQKIAQKLERQGLKVAAIHGNKTQPQRARALSQFKDDRIQALIATDVAARGLDIPHVTHVINFDVPQTYEDYTHRIGRTGRAGRSGTALTFVQQ